MLVEISKSWFYKNWEEDPKMIEGKVRRRVFAWNKSIKWFSNQRCKSKKSWGEKPPQKIKIKMDSYQKSFV